MLSPAVCFCYRKSAFPHKYSICFSKLAGITNLSAALQFPKDFTWGAATSSYQIEGAWLAGGKGLSIWDVFAHTPGKIRNQENGNVAADHYHRFRDDVALMAKMGLKAYRFSISWPRIQPSGYGEVNAVGIRFYSELIDALHEQGIEPWVTLYHWDLPATLQFEQDGWLSEKTADCFADYADICFRHFGDRITKWITFNEPWVTAVLGYGHGTFAPGRISNVEPYLAAHQMLRAHGLAVERFRQASYPGKISMANNADWREPASSKPEDVAAAQRALEFFLGWFADPLYFGDYPAVMHERVGNRLPTFSEEDRKRIKGSSDFFGLNHYTTMLTAYAQEVHAEDAFSNAGLVEDQQITLSADPTWKKTDMGWPIVPEGCRKLLEWIHHRYGSPPIIITENGCAVPNEFVNGSVNDQPRINYIQAYLKVCHQAIENGVDLRGYFVWSFIDNFEWALGYEKRFGLHYVDYKTLERIPKESAGWYAGVIQQNGL